MTADIAYHADKFDRGFDRLIDIWGADHHGYVARVKASLEAKVARPEYVSFDADKQVGSLVRVPERD